MPIYVINREKIIFLNFNFNITDRRTDKHIKSIVRNFTIYDWLYHYFIYKKKSLSIIVVKKSSKVVDIKKKKLI